MTDKDEEKEGQEGPSTALTVTAENVSEALKVVSAQLAKSAEEVPGFARKDRHDLALVSLGSVILITVLCLRILPLDLGFGYLAPSEFIAVIMAGTLLTISGSVVRIYFYKGGIEQSKGLQQVAETLVEKDYELTWGSKPSRIDSESQADT